MNKKTTLFRRITAITLFACLAFSSVGCANSTEASSSDTEDVPMEQLEYGATMRDDDSYAVPVEYDKRYLEDPELKALTDFYAAIQNEDAETFSAGIVNFYLDYLLENTYGGLLDASAFVTQQHETFRDYVDNDDFSFTQVQVTDCKYKDSTTSGVSYLTDMFDELEGEGYSDEHVKDCKALTVQLLITADDKTVTSDSLTIFVVNLDGSYFVCP